MTIEQLTDIVLKHNSDLSALTENVKSAHKRIDENDRMIEGIHKLAANVESLTMQVKLLAGSVENSVTELKGVLKAQAERITVLEKTSQTVEHNKKGLSTLSGKVDAIEKEPAHKWKALVAQIISLAVAAVVGGVVSKFVN